MIHARASQKYHIESWRSSGQLAKNFAGNALYPVALDRKFYVALGNDETQTMSGSLVGCSQKKQMLVAGLCCHIVKDPPVITGGEKAAGFAEPVLSLHRGIRRVSPPWTESGRKDLAAFGAAAIEDLAAVFGCHAGAEAVGALAFQNAGLECSLHVCIT